MKYRVYFRWIRIKSHSRKVPLACRIGAKVLVLLAVVIARFSSFFLNHFIGRSLSAISQLLGIGLLTWVLFQLIAVTDEAVENHARLHLQDLNFVEVQSQYRPGDLVWYSTEHKTLASTPICRLQGVAIANPADTISSFRSYSVLAGDGAIFESFFAWLQSALSTSFPVDRVTYVDLFSLPDDRHRIDPKCIASVIPLVERGECVLMVDAVAAISETESPAFSRKFIRYRNHCLINLDTPDIPVPPPRTGPDILTRIAIALSLIRFSEVE